MKAGDTGIAKTKILILLATALMFFSAGYYFANKSEITEPYNTMDTESSVNSSREAVSTPAPESEWLLYTSSQGSYTIRLADGLVFEGSDPSSTYQSLFTLSDMKEIPGKQAEVIPPGPGKDGVTGMFINYFTNEEPPFDGELIEEFKTASGLDIKKYYFVQDEDPQGIGLQIGDKQYTFIVSHGTQKLQIGYSIPAAQEGNVSLVERMVKTVTLQ